MTATLSRESELIEPTTVRLQRLLPGPIDRVWTYITDSDLRAQWFAAGPMELRAGGAVKLTWRNDELSSGKGDDRPEGMPAEHSMEAQITACDPPHLLAMSWGVASNVTFELEKQGQGVLLTITHRKLPGRNDIINVSAGWRVHVDLLEARLNGETPPPFWPSWKAQRDHYDAKIPR